MRLCPSCNRMKPATHFYPTTGTPRCTSHLKWNQARRFKLLTLIDEGLSDAEIAQRLNTTRGAVEGARSRYHIHGVSSHSLSGQQVARMMGVPCSKSVTKWIEAGFLDAKRIRPMGPHKTWLITHEALYAFVEDERTWHVWRPDRIADTRLRRHAERVRGGVRFLTPGEVADRYCCTHYAVNQWIHKGFIRARKWGNWLIDERDLERFELPQLGGDRRRTA